MEFFAKKKKFIINIWQGANVFELVDVSYYKEAWLSLTRLLSDANIFKKFMAKLTAFFEKGEGRQPIITCPNSLL